MPFGDGVLLAAQVVFKQHAILATDPPQVVVQFRPVSLEFGPLFLGDRLQFGHVLGLVLVYFAWVFADGEGGEAHDGVDELGAARGDVTGKVVTINGLLSNILTFNSYLDCLVTMNTLWMFSSSSSWV